MLGIGRGFVPLVINAILSSLKARPHVVMGLLAAAAIALPPLLLGPWLPLLDLQAFVGMNSYPPQLSYGPFHYYVFQFTYIGHYALSRLLYNLHFSVSSQVVFIYLLQAGVALAVIYFSLGRLVENVWLRAAGVALGALAFWDGLFLWGGPLAFSLAAMCLTVGTFLVMREASEPGRPAGLPVALLTFSSLTCHPFALPFALMLGGLRTLFVPHRRLQSLILLGGLALFGWVIVNDSPASEGAAAGRLSELFAFSGTEIAARFIGLFQRDAVTVQHLFGFVPPALMVYFLLMGAVHLVGFIAAPLLVIYAGQKKWLRMLGVLNSVVAVLYFLSVDRPGGVIPEWPQRILTFYSCFTFLTGVAGPLFLLRRYRGEPEVVERVPVFLRWLCPMAMIGIVVMAQVPIFRLGANLGAIYQGLRAAVAKSGMSNAYVVVSNVDVIKPYYLRAVPFLLFSDPEIVSRNVILFTEWHHQSRHPTRVTEAWFDLGRTRYVADFKVKDGKLGLDLTLPPADEFPVPVHTRGDGFGTAANLAQAHHAQGVALYQAGAMRDAFGHFQTAIRLAPDFAEAHRRLGAILAKSEQWAAAKKEFETVVSLRPDSAEGRLDLAEVLLTMGEKEQALRQIEAALKLQPASERARQLQKRAG